MTTISNKPKLRKVPRYQTSNQSIGHTEYYMIYMITAEAMDEIIEVS